MLGEANGCDFGSTGSSVGEGCPDVAGLIVSMADLANYINTVEDALLNAHLIGDAMIGWLPCECPVCLLISQRRAL